MGNIGNHSFQSIFKQSHNQDNPSTKSQQNGNTSNQRNSQQIMTSYNPKKQSLIQLNVSESSQLQIVVQNLSLYSAKCSLSQRQKNPSISTLKEYYRVKKQGYCTNQNIFYLIFYGCNCCGLKSQFGARKMLGKQFSDQQILNSLKAYLAGIYAYSKQFKRYIQRIDLDDIGFEMSNLINPKNESLSQRNQARQKIRMYFIDPWIKQKREQQVVNVNQVNILLQNPSPQRLQTSSSSYSQFNAQNNMNSYDNAQYISEKEKGSQKSTFNQSQLHSLLFSVGVIGLKMLQMNFVDDIYVKFPTKKVNQERIQRYLEKHLSTKFPESEVNSLNSKYATNILRQRLISGLRILLLSNKAKQRQKIYDFWSVNLQEMCQLKQTNLEMSSDHLRSDTQVIMGQQRQNILSSFNSQIRDRVNQTMREKGAKLYEAQNNYYTKSEQATAFHDSSNHLGRYNASITCNKNTTSVNNQYNQCGNRRIVPSEVTNYDNYTYKLQRINNHQQQHVRGNNLIQHRNYNTIQQRNKSIQEKNSLSQGNRDKYLRIQQTVNQTLTSPPQQPISHSNMKMQYNVQRQNKTISNQLNGPQYHHSNQQKTMVHYSPYKNQLTKDHFYKQNIHKINHSLQGTSFNT